MKTGLVDTLRSAGITNGLKPDANQVLAATCRWGGQPAPVTADRR